MQFRSLIHNGCAHPSEAERWQLAARRWQQCGGGELNIDATSQNGRLKMRLQNAFDTVGSNSYMKVDSNNQRLILVGGVSVHTIKVGEGGASAVEIDTTNQQTSFEMASDASAFSFRRNSDAYLRFDTSAGMCSSATATVG